MKQEGQPSRRKAEQRRRHERGEDDRCGRRVPAQSFTRGAATDLWMDERARERMLVTFGELTIEDLLAVGTSG